MDKKNDPGKGWRFLEVDEKINFATDEYWSDFIGHWEPCCYMSQKAREVYAFGWQPEAPFFMNPFRRKKIGENFKA